MIPYADATGVSHVQPRVVSGAVVARIVEVWPHPHADLLWVADIDPGTGWLKRVVHGGTRRLLPGDLVAYAPVGARLSTGRGMRTRSYRGVRSEGMLCSLNELGWTHDGPDEVAVLHDLTPGHPLDTGELTMPSIGTRQDDTRSPSSAEYQQVAPAPGGDR